VQKNIQPPPVLQEGLASRTPGRRGLSDVLWRGVTKPTMRQRLCLNYYKFFGGRPTGPHTSRRSRHRGEMAKIFGGITYEDSTNATFDWRARKIWWLIKWAQSCTARTPDLGSGWAGCPHMMPSLERFAKYVMPHFRCRFMLNFFIGRVPMDMRSILARHQANRR
jgi:hypothetical protein